MSENENEIDTKGLDQLLKAIKEKQHSLKVGILGSNTRNGKGNSKSTSTNAEIGAVHEFGAPGKGIPQRSFLRIPITQNLQKEILKSDIMTENKIKEVIKQGSFKPWLESLGVLCVGISLDAFDQEGPGWPKWKDPHYVSGHGSILDDTGQLKSSVSWEVK